jgi:hypothetical protein
MVLIQDSEINKIKYLMRFDVNKTLTENTTPQYTQQQLDAAKKKITTDRQKNAQLIYNEIKKSFDRDNDGDLKDNDFTDESGALAAINKIKYKEELDYIEYLVKKQGQYKSLKEWLNDEMSDWDSEYGDIWSKLQGLGYLGRNTNYVLKVAGFMFKYSIYGVLANLGENVISTVRDWGLDDWINWMRDAVNGVLGTIGLAVLNAIPVAGQLINFLANGLVAVGGAYQLFSSKVIGWFQFVIDAASAILSILGSQVLMKPFKVAFKASPALQKVNKLGDLLTQLKSKFPSVGNGLKVIGQKGASAITSIISATQKGLDLLIKHIPFAGKIFNYIKGLLTKATGWLKSFTDDVVISTGEVAGKKVATKTASKLTSSLLGKIDDIYKNGKYLTKWGRVNIRKGISMLSTNKYWMSGLQEAEKEFITFIQKKISSYATENISTVRPYFCSGNYGKWRKKETAAAASTGLVAGGLGTDGEAWCTGFDFVLSSAIIGSELYRKGNKIKKYKKDTDLNQTANTIKKIEQTAKNVKAGTKITQGSVENIDKLTKDNEDKSQRNNSTASAIKQQVLGPQT